MTRAFLQKYFNMLNRLNAIGLHNIVNNLKPSFTVAY